MLALELAYTGNAGATSTRLFEMGKKPVQQLFCSIKEQCLQQAYTTEGLQAAHSHEVIVHDPPTDLGREASGSVGNMAPMSARRHEAVLKISPLCSHVIVACF